MSHIIRRPLCAGSDDITCAFILHIDALGLGVRHVSMVGRDEPRVAHLYRSAHDHKKILRNSRSVTSCFIFKKRSDSEVQAKDTEILCKETGAIFPQYMMYQQACAER